jgi:two-component system, cell cycle sensor histidine kinase and response regulator CckA
MSLVLIVEDEDALRVLAESIIQHHGYEALSAGTVEQAIALLEGDQKPDLLFTDLGLRDDLQAGLTAAQEAVKRIPGLPVLYTTGEVLTDGMRAMFVERSAFVAKPYTDDQLCAAIDELLNAGSAEESQHKQR